MYALWFLILVCFVPWMTYRFLRPRERGTPEDYAPFPLILRAAGGIWQYPAFLLLGAIANTPLLLLLVLDRFLYAGPAVVMGVLWFVVVVPQLVQGAVTHGALRPLRRARPTSGEILRGGLVGLVRSVPVAVAVVSAAVLALSLGHIGARDQMELGQASVADTFWFSAMLTAAVVVCALYLAPAVAVDRKQSVHRALGESLAVTFHYRMRMLGIILFFGVVQLVLLSVVLALGWRSETRELFPGPFIAVAYPIGTFVTTWHGITAVIVYHRQRKLKYGGEVDGLLEVFD